MPFPQPRARLSHTTPPGAPAHTREVPVPARMRKRKFPLPGYVHLAKQFFLTILFKYSLSAHAFFSVEVPGSSRALGTWGGTALRRQHVMQCWLWLAHQDEGVIPRSGRAPFGGRHNPCLAVRTARLALLLTHLLLLAVTA